VGPHAGGSLLLAALSVRFNHMVLAHYNVSIYGEEAFGNRIVETTLFKKRSMAFIRQPVLVKRSPPGIWGSSVIDTGRQPTSLRPFVKMTSSS
jgi:hypothetical protein